MALVERYPAPPALSKNPFPHSTFPVRGVTSGLLSSGLNYPVLAQSPPGWEGPPPSPLQQLIATPEGFLAKQRRKNLAEGGVAGASEASGRFGGGQNSDTLGRRGRGGRGAGSSGRGGRGRGYGGSYGYGYGGINGGGGGEDAWFDEGDEEEDAAVEAAEEGLGIGMPVRVCNFFAPGTDCYNGLIGDVVKVQTVAENPGEEEFLFTVRCLCSIQRRRTFSPLSEIPVSPMAHEAIAANRKVLRPGAGSDEMAMDDLPPMVILDKLPSEKLEALS